MKNHLLLSLSLGLLLSLAAPSAQAQELKVGVVDFSKIQRHYYRTVAERKLLEEKRDAELKKLEEPVAEAKKLLDEQKTAQEALQDPTLSDDKKKDIVKAAEKRAGEIMILQRKTAELQNVANTSLAQEANSAQSTLNQEIYDAITKTAETKGLDLIHNKTFGLNGIPTVAYASASKLTDITDDVIGILNKNAPAGFSPGADDAKPAATSSTTKKK